MEGQDYKGFKLGEKKAIREKEADFAALSKTVIAKLGTGWEVKFDWATIYANSPEDQRLTLGDIFYVSFMKGLVKDVESMDAEVIEALNDAVGDKKVITFTTTKTADGDFGTGGGTYRIEFKDGVLITYKAEWSRGYPYPYNDYTIKAFVLKNC